jgi:hypothetical protein
MRYSAIRKISSKALHVLNNSARLSVAFANGRNLNSINELLQQ